MRFGRVLGLVALGVSGVLVAATLLVSTREPSLSRAWDDDVAVLADVRWLPEGGVRLEGIRDWRYSRDSVLSREYFDAVYDPADVEGLWLYEQELGLGGAIAHTFLVFEFGEDYGPTRWLGLSVETRREAGETYSILRGMLRDFELTHVWATEDDLVTRRVEYLDYPLTRYRVDVPPEYRPRIFRQFVEATAALATTPRWYNTVRTNCTSSLIEYVNAMKPGAIPGHYSSVLTGRADDHLARLGYLDPQSATPVNRESLERGGLR